jgi:hypothetical protein
MKQTKPLELSIIGPCSQMPMATFKRSNLKKYKSYRGKKIADRLGYDVVISDGQTEYIFSPRIPRMD